ncbi:MAG: AIM24 family protein [Myxococcales bacterium]|nr:AIM24 family protein [Myxococcales bacterium]
MTFSADEFDLELEAVSELLERGALEEADSRARALLKARPSNPLARNVMALIDFARGRHGAAFETFASLARRNADVVSLRVNAGVAALCAGELEVAHDNLRRAVDLDSGHRRAFAYLAVVHLMNGQRHLARAALLEADFVDLATTVGEGPIEPIVSAARALADRLGPGAEGAPQPRAFEGFAELGALERDAAPRRANPSSSLVEAVQSVVDAPAAAPPSSAEAASSGSASTAALAEPGESAAEAAEEIQEDLDEAFDALQMSGAAALEPDSTGELAMDSADARAAAEEFAPDAAPTSVTAEEDIDFGSNVDDAFDELTMTGGGDPHTRPTERFSRPLAGSDSVNGDGASSDAAESDAARSDAASIDAARAAAESTAPTPEPPTEAPLAAARARRISATVATPGRKPACFEHLPQLVLAGSDAAEVDGPTLRLTVEAVPRFDHVFVREDLLVASRGDVRFETAHSRRKGAQQEPFMVAGQPLWRVVGAAEHLLLAPHEHRFELIHLVDESVYVAERCLAAFSAGLRWENGRIPGSTDDADAIVELSGRGLVVLHTRGDLARLAVEGAPVEVRSEHLLGWAGDTVPSASTVSATPGPHVECRGNGVLLLSAPRGLAGAAV